MHGGRPDLQQNCRKNMDSAWHGTDIDLRFLLEAGSAHQSTVQICWKSALQSSSPFFLCWHQVDQNWDLNVYICMCCYLVTCLLWDAPYKIYLGTYLCLDFVYVWISCTLSWVWFVFGLPFVFLSSWICPLVFSMIAQFSMFFHFFKFVHFVWFSWDVSMCSLDLSALPLGTSPCYVILPAMFQYVHSIAFQVSRHISQISFVLRLFLLK